LKRLLLFLLLGIITLSAQDWQIKNINFYQENDGDALSDEAYSYGGKLAVLFFRDNNSILHIPFTDYKNQDNYISFSYNQKIYTPEAIREFALQPDDRAYAGYMYLQSALHQSYNNRLQSLILQAGLIGPSAHLEDVQDFIHGIIGSPIPNGWENQLSDEFTFQINYAQKYFMQVDKIFGLEAVLLPEWGLDIGNVSTRAYGALMYRFGWGVPKDYGSSTIDNNSYSKIPLSPEQKYTKEWDFCFNLGLRTNAIAKNIFLDGNRNVPSHSVEKNYLTLEGIYGISLIYDHWSFDYIRTHTTKEYRSQSGYKSYGSWQFSYNF